MIAMQVLTTVVDVLGKVVASSSAEITVFVVAISLHLLLFGNGFGMKRRVSKKPPCALEKSKGLPSSVRPPSTLSSAASSRMAEFKESVASGRFESALAILQESPDMPAVHYNMLLDMCASNGDVAAMERVLADAVASGVANAASYGRAMRVYLKLGDMTKVRHIFCDMQAAGIKPSTAAFNELLDATAKQSGGAMWKVVDHMTACGVRPSAITCSILLKNLQPPSGKAYMDRAMALLEDMDEAVDDILFSSLIEACIRTSRIDLLSRALQRQDGPQRVQLQSSQAYGSIIRAHGMLHNVTAVWAAWSDLQERGIPRTSITVGCMTEAIASNGDPEGSHNLIRELLAEPQSRSLVNAVNFCSVLKGFSHQKRFDRVWSVYKEMLQEGMQVTVVTYNTLLDACARCSEMSYVPTLLEDMAGKGIQLNVISYSIIIKGYCQVGCVGRAFRLMDEMRDTAKLRPDEHTYNTVINGCAREGLYDEGVALLREMCDAGVAPSNFTLTVLVKLASRGRRLDVAFEFCETLSQKYGIRLNVHVYNALVQACCQQTHIPRAIKVVHRMVREGMRTDVRTYTLLLRACVQFGEARHAAATLRAACGLRGACRELEELPHKLVRPSGGLPESLVVEVLQGIARQCHDEDLARELLEELRQLPGSRLKASAVFGKATQERERFKR
mmetsp:Transcript_119443/g.337999  ORF Transcript_119443/g.337999 Transcript_119443/m.337999 type:complete len:674 (+) Transcript_119443:125-2146(+)